MYNNIQKRDDIIRLPSPSVNINFVDGPFVEINNFPDSEYFINMFSGDILLFRTKISNGMWAKANKKYFTIWTLKLENASGEVVWSYKQDLTGKKIFISLESKSLGDTIAWFPYVEEFRKKHNCQVVVSTFLNELFKLDYSDIEFVNPGEVVHNIYAQYRIGWFYDGDEPDFNKNPKDFRKTSLQQTASDILGLDTQEIRPVLNLKRPQKLKKVGIGIHSTAQAKYWNNPDGWQQVVDYLNSLGYEVVIYSREEDGYMGNKQPLRAKKFAAQSLDQLISDLETCQFFIGLGSGLSWLAWACDLPVILISGFSDTYSETTDKTLRVINKSVCNSCFNSHRLNASDWNWCPIHKGTQRQFECTKAITSDMVIEQINKIIY